MNYNEYYARQAGGSLPYFAGASFQRGHGLGSLFVGLLRNAMPLIKRGAVALGRGALKTGVRIAGDVLSGQNINTAAKRRVTDAGRTVSAEEARFLLRWKAKLKLMLVLSGIIKNYDMQFVFHSFYCSYLKCYSLNCLNCEGSGVSGPFAQRSLRSSGPALPQL